MSDLIVATIACIVGVVTLKILLWRTNQKLKRLESICHARKHTQNIWIRLPYVVQFVRQKEKKHEY